MTSAHPMRCARDLLACTLAVLAAGCATTTTVDPTGSSHAAKPESCRIAVVAHVDGDNAPAGYTRIGRVETHIVRNMFGGGQPTVDDAMPELRTAACKLGGDALAIDDTMTTSATETRHLHVWASVFARNAGG
jgi:hypothetical protein